MVNISENRSLFMYIFKKTLVFASFSFLTFFAYAQEQQAPVQKTQVTVEKSSIQMPAPKVVQNDQQATESPSAKKSLEKITEKIDKSLEKPRTFNEIGIKVGLGNYRDYLTKRPLDPGRDARTFLGSFRFLGTGANPAEYHGSKGATLVAGKDLASSYYSLFNTYGGFYYIYTPDAGPGYKFDLTALVKYDRNINGQNAGMDLLFQFDNSVFGNLIPKSVDFLRFDLGFTTRLYTGGILINFMLYYDFEGKIPDTGVVFNFTGNVGLADIHNSDVKLSIAYEFGDKIKNGIELGYQHLGQSAFVIDVARLFIFNTPEWNWNDKAISMDALFLGFYTKY